MDDEPQYDLTEQGSAVVAGAEAFAAGLTLDDNPHSDNSPNGVAWREAWRTAEQAVATAE
jgi:hypothetical protein